ncbi:group II intron maturase-specific domain-containing protein, partial [Allocoleopsis sp.]|uniref:group II intron maturase-specific domain-containing protein n=1 Tax=Allocoleopsis sp. TaxID=3088169 RepID=UPI002FD1673E
VVNTHKGTSQKRLIEKLNPIIRGWTNYYSTVCSKKAFSKMDAQIYTLLESWAKHRHRNKGRKWLAQKYWKTIGGDNWVFATRDGKNPIRLLKHSATQIKDYVKVKCDASPYDGNLVYWSIRMGKNPEMPKRTASLLKQQKGICTHCGHYFKDGDVIELDHIIPKSQGGKDEYKNWQLLHRHCHDIKTATDTRRYVDVSGNKSGCNSAEPKPTKRLEKS